MAIRDSPDETTGRIGSSWIVIMATTACVLCAWLASSAPIGESVDNADAAPGASEVVHGVEPRSEEAANARAAPSGSAPTPTPTTRSTATGVLVEVLSAASLLDRRDAASVELTLPTRDAVQSAADAVERGLSRYSDPSFGGALSHVTIVGALLVDGVPAVYAFRG